MCFYINIFFTAIVSEKFMTARTENKSVFFFFKQSENSLPHIAEKNKPFHIIVFQQHRCLAQRNAHTHNTTVIICILS